MAITDYLNPFTGFGLIDAGLEHMSAKDLQHRGFDFDREMWDKQSAFAVEQFGRESEFTKEMMDKQYGLNQKAYRDTPTNYMKGLKQSGLNPILAATGGFRANVPGVSQGSAKATAGSPSRGGSPSGARSNVALASKYGALLESEVDLNTAKATAERAKAGLTDLSSKVVEVAAMLAQIVAGMIEASNIDRETTKEIWQWLTSELPEGEKKLSKEEQVRMLDKAKRKFPQLKGVDNAKRKIFGAQ